MLSTPMLVNEQDQQWLYEHGGRTERDVFEFEGTLYVEFYHPGKPNNADWYPLPFQKKTLPSTGE